MRRIQLTLAVVLISSIMAAQEQHSQKRASVSTGQKTIVGCIAMGSSGYELQTQEGRHIPLRGRDLSGFVGKKVQINATWEQRGLSLALPLEEGGGEAAAAGGSSGSSATHEFAGDIHLKLHGSVVGDCLGNKK